MERKMAINCTNFNSHQQKLLRGKNLYSWKTEPLPLQHDVKSVLATTGHHDSKYILFHKDPFFYQFYFCIRLLVCNGALRAVWGCQLKLENDGSLSDGGICCLLMGKVDLVLAYRLGQLQLWCHTLSRVPLALGVETDPSIRPIRWGILLFSDCDCVEHTFESQK